MENMRILLRTGTTDSNQEYKNILALTEPNRQQTGNFRDSLYSIDEKIRLLEIREAKSEISHSSKLSNTLILKQAQLEAARVKLRFAEK